MAVVAALALGAVGTLGAVPTAASAAPGDEATPLSVPGMPVSLAQAGELALWGDNTYGQATVPASLAGVAITQLAIPQRARLALTADGRVVGWGSNADRLERVPAEVAEAKVAQIAVARFGGYAGAVTRDGRVLTWGKPRSFPNPVRSLPAGLSGVKQLAMTEYAAAALKHDGTVVAWGQSDWGQTAVPEGLRATAIAAMSTTFLALTDDGRVVSWGQPLARGIPDILEAPGSVKAIAAGVSRAVALLAEDNTLVQFGCGDIPEGVCALPAEIAAADPVLLSDSDDLLNEFAIVDRDRAIHHWYPPIEGVPEQGLPGEVPPALNGRDLAQIVVGFGSLGGDQDVITGGVVITKMLRAELPQVSGAVKVGSVLTGVPGTFSAAPDAVTSQWLVDGAPVAGAQLTVTAAMVGKTISYQSTATKAGEASVSSASPGVVVPAAGADTPDATVPSTTKVLKVKVAKKAKKLVMSGQVTASKSPAGKAKVTIKKGKKRIVAKNVNVSAKGEVKLTVKKFGKLVVKKLTPKKKGKKGKKGKKPSFYGKYVVSIDYLGNAQVDPSTAAKKFTVKKAKKKGKKGKK